MGVYVNPDAVICWGWWAVDFVQRDRAVGVKDHRDGAQRFAGTVAKRCVGGHMQMIMVDRRAYVAIGG